MKGTCCWQKPCGFPALNVEISGDGNSIVFQGDIDHVGAGWSIDGKAGFPGGMKTGMLSGNAVWFHQKVICGVYWLDSAQSVQMFDV